MEAMTIRPAGLADRQFIAEALRARWGGTGVAFRGRLVDALALPALIAERDGRPCGVATFELRADVAAQVGRDGGAAAGVGPASGLAELEIVTLDALEQRSGVGTALIGAIAALAQENGARRLVVVTTNDNLDALRFYQRRGFTISAVRPGAIAEARRRIKPSIPATGSFGIPIRDEIELELRV